MASAGRQSEGLLASPSSLASESRLLITEVMEGPREVCISDPSGVPTHGYSHWGGQVLSKKVISLPNGSELSQAPKERVLRG